MYQLQTDADAPIPISIDAESGRVFLSRQLTSGDARSFEMLVRATDTGAVQLTSNVARLVVSVVSDANRLQMSVAHSTPEQLQTKQEQLVA